MTRSRSAAKEAFKVQLKKINMKNDKYESPAIEIVKIELNQAVLVGSFTGENIKEWEDM